MQFLRQIVGAHQEAADARGSGGDLLGTQDAARRLDHAPDRHVVRCAMPAHQSLDALHRLGALDLRQQQGMGPATGQPRDIRLALRQIGRASCRERGSTYVWFTEGAVTLKKKKKKTNK